MRGLKLVALGAFVLVVAGWTTNGPSGPQPPECFSASIHHRATLTYFRGGRVYERSCGPGRVVVRYEGRTHNILGGYCNGGRVPFGLTTAARDGAASGFGVIVPRQTGRVMIDDGVLQIDGLHLGLGGTALINKGFKSATFTLTARPTGKPVTGRWRCD